MVQADAPKGSQEAAKWSYYITFGLSTSPCVCAWSRRKLQREAKKQRKEAEMGQHAEEIKRLKNLKKKEIEEKWVL